jgi:hypothetical protein
MRHLLLALLIAFGTASFAENSEYHAGFVHGFSEIYRGVCGDRSLAPSNLSFLREVERVYNARRSNSDAITGFIEGSQRAIDAYQLAGKDRFCPFFLESLVNEG